VPRLYDCVDTVFGAPAMAAGSFCVINLAFFRAQIMNPGARCPDGFPFQVSTVSREGVMGDYCVPSTRSRVGALVIL
jgi:hypothetical protein